MTTNAFQRALEDIQKQVRVKTLGGEKSYTYQLLKRREAARIYHTTVSTVLAAIAQAAGGEGPTSKLEAIKAIDFETVWDLAGTLLKGAQIRPEPDVNPDFFVTITDIDKCDYFEGEPEELYIAVYHGLKANYPKSWGRVERALRDFGPRIEALVGTSKTASTPGPSRPTTSPSSGA